MSEDKNFGWVSLHRRSIESSVFQDMRTWYVWSWCLMKANHKTRVVPFNGVDIEIARGSFITGRTSALSELHGLTAQRYRTALEYLKSTSRITTKATNKFTIITISNYDEYQNVNLQDDQQNNQQTNQPVTNQQPTNNQPVTTNNNDNNVNNENNVNKVTGRILKKSAFIPPTLDDVKAYFKEKGYTEDAAIRAFNHYDAGNWHDVKGKPVQIWRQQMNKVWFKPENKISDNKPMMP